MLRLSVELLKRENALRNGRTEPSVDDVPKLQFVEQCFREALRLYSPVQGITRDVAYDTLLNGHRVYQGERISVFTRALHTNPEHLIRTSSRAKNCLSSVRKTFSRYWGGEFGDPLSFNPDRFSPEACVSQSRTFFDTCRPFRGVIPTLTTPGALPPEPASAASSHFLRPSALAP